jgi:uncharacterized membrane protein YbhN (UPF0104 family)
VTRTQRATTLFVAAALLLGAVAVLRHAAAGIAIADWRVAVGAVRPVAIAASVVLTACSFICLGMLEVVASRTVANRSVRRSHALSAGVVAHALCNTLGFHAVLAPGLRLVLYRSTGVTAGDVARLLVPVAGGIAAGVAGCAALAAGAAAAGRTGLVAVGVAVAAVLASWRQLVRIAPRDAPVARVLQAGPAAAAIGLCESAFAIAALYVLMPHAAVESLPRFVLAFASAGLLGVVSHAPGGIGVFEATMLGALPGDRAPLLAALLLYRVIYNLAPAALAAVVIAVRVGVRRTSVSSMAGNA